MDSMRSLNKSLPSSRPNRQTPPEQLLQAFRSAALSVTNLYKSAAADQANARHAGYQDALNDLLTFLDEENLGLQDGEGWRIRQWATQRYDGSNQQFSENEDESNEVDDERNSIRQSHSPTPAHREDTTVDNPDPTPSADDNHTEENQETTSHPTPMYTFTGNTSFRENDMQTDAPSSPQPVESEPSSSSPVRPIRVEVLNRHSKPASRTQNGRNGNKSSSRDFTFTAGTKRKWQFPDFFDISNVGDSREGFDGGNETKRGKLV